MIIRILKGAVTSAAAFTIALIVGWVEFGEPWWISLTVVSILTGIVSIGLNSLIPRLMGEMRLWTAAAITLVKAPFLGAVIWFLEQMPGHPLHVHSVVQGSILCIMLGWAAVSPISMQNRNRGAVRKKKN